MHMLNIKKSRKKHMSIVMPSFTLIMLFIVFISTFLIFAVWDCEIFGAKKFSYVFREHLNAS